MKDKAKWVVKAAGAGTIALILATPSFAQSRNEQRRGNNDDRGRVQSTYRENQRVTAEGRVSSFKRERDGYRVQLDQGRYSYWVPQSHFRNRRNGLNVGLSIRLGGIFRNGAIYVDAVNWPGDNDYRRGNNDRSVDGYVDRIDVRSDTLWLRDDRGGELIAVHMRDSDRRGRGDLRDLRRGDYVELAGEWVRGGVFNAYRIEDVRSRR
jgi:hypothetical protein